MVLGMLHSDHLMLDWVVPKYWPDIKYSSVAHVGGIHVYAKVLCGKEPSKPQ